MLVAQRPMAWIVAATKSLSMLLMYVCRKKKILTKSSNTRRRLLSRLGESLLAEESDFQLWFKTIPKVQFNRPYLKLSENGGDVCLIGQIGEDLQLQNTKKKMTILKSANLIYKTLITVSTV